MGYTFVSYSRRQLYFAESVALSLQRTGLDVWFDLQKLTPGVDWASALKDGYGNCDRLILIASQSAIQSPYVRVEWETALANGHEVIVVLSEAVVLPEALQGCAVYDARTHFDRTMQSLIAYLRGEQPARQDAVPSPGKSPYTLKMPFDIWLTLGVMFMPTLTAWIAILSLPPNIVDFNLNFDFITKYLPGLSVQAVLFYLVGFLSGGYLALVQFPIREFWQHDVQYEKLKDIRWNLLWIQIVVCFLVLLGTLLIPGTNGANRFGYFILIFPLISAYWSFRVLGRSPDILRWMPSGEADQEMRETVQGKLSAELPEQPDARKVLPVREATGFALHHHPADAYNARFIRAILRSGGCQPAPEGEAEVHLIVVSNRTSKGWLLELDKTLPGLVIHILATNINTPPELQPVLQTQWVDFRTGRVKTLKALAAYLTNKDSASIDYGMQISPTGFDTANGFSRRAGFVIGFFFLIFPLPFVVMGILGIGEERMVLALIVALAIALVLYVDALLMRRASLPARIHKILGHRVAWFASPAPAAPDPIGNTDRKYVSQLTSWLPRN